MQPALDRSQTKYKHIRGTAHSKFIGSVQTLDVSGTLCLQYAGFVHILSMQEIVTG